VAVASASTDAHGQSWPERPVTIIVPYSPGGNTDGIARIMAQRLGAVLGRQFVVENKPGANGATVCPGCEQEHAGKDPGGIRRLRARSAE
jgi:tripartite-type tricarboxylate transporter receptor subunit TctC